MFAWLWPPTPTPQVMGSSSQGLGQSIYGGSTTAKRVREIEQVLDDRKMWPRIREAPNAYDLIYVDPRSGGKLYLGGIAALDDRAFMSKIDAVVSMVDNERFPLDYVERYVGPNKGLFYASVADDERENISRYFDRSANFIEHHLRKGLNVFVHCAAGISRSTTTVANWVMRRHNLSALDALMLIKSRRPIIRPNRGFIRQLVEVTALKGGT